MWINKQKNVLDFTLSSLLRRKGKNTALTLVYIGVVFMLASVSFFTNSIKREAAVILKDAPEMVVQRMVAGRHDLIPLAYMDKIGKIRGVSSIKHRLWGYYFDPVTGANYTLMAEDNFKHGEGDIAIGKGISKSRLAYEGDIMPFRAHNGANLNLKVKEVMSYESDIVSSDLILLSESDFKKIFGIQKGYATDLTLKVRNPKEIRVVAAKITGIFPDTRPITRDEILRTYDSVFDWRSGIMVVILLSAGLSFVIFAWDKASGLSAEEKKEIGILKAVGWETSDVILMKFWEGMVISLTAFLAGIILAYIHVFFASGIIFEPVLKGWSVIYPEFRLTPFIDPYQITTLFFLTVMPYTVAVIIPSWRAATIDPDSVMR
jgi:ABC-type lipoprotein release transport system permease subunit